MSTITEKFIVSLSRDPEQSHSDAERCGSREDDPFWILNDVFPDFQNLVRGKHVLDFGCGRGCQCIALVEAGAQYVVGIDTNPNALKKAEELLMTKGYNDRVEFVSSIPEKMLNSFDVVISHNSFEHFPDPQFILSQMRKAAKPEGKILITFGPPWFAPFGAHMNYFIKMPWIHMIFSEKTIMNVRARFRNDGAKKYEDVEGGLNKMSVAKFERIIASSGLKVAYQRYDCIRKLNFLKKLPCARELFINHISCICIA